jgi:hypothetical protein
VRRHCDAMSARCGLQIASPEQFEQPRLCLLADQRPAPGRGAGDSGDCSVALRAPSAAPESVFFRFDIAVLSNEILGRRSWSD